MNAPPALDLAGVSAGFLELTLLIARILALTSWIGCGAALTALPPFYRRRWPWLAAPVGAALFMVCVVPFSRAGVPVGRVWPWFLALVSAANLAVLAGAFRGVAIVRRALRHGARLARRALAPALVCGALVPGIAALMITGAGTSKIRDVWGGGDYESYWVVADYLDRFGGNEASFLAQAEFHDVNPHQHVVIWARLGGMAYLSFLAATLTPTSAHHILNAAAVAFLLILLSATQCALDRFRLRARWTLTLAACHPFLYFPLYFSAINQALSIPLAVTALLVFEEHLADPAPSTALLSAVLVASCLVSYPGVAPLLTVFAALHVLRLIRHPAPRARRGALRVLNLVLLMTCYYLPSVMVELMVVTRKLSGWDWARPISFLELTGVRTVLGFDIPAPLTPVVLWPAELLLALLLAHGLARALAASRRSLILPAILLTTLVLGLQSLHRVHQGTFGATHGWAKVLSQFCILLFSVSVHAYVAAATRSTQSSVRGVLCTRLALGLWLLAALTGVLHTDRRARASDELVSFVRQVFPPGRPPRFAPYLLRNPPSIELELFAVTHRSDWLLEVRDHRITPEKKFPGPVRCVARLPCIDPSQIIDRSAHYASCLPPSDLDASRVDSWLVEGTAHLAPRDTARRACVLGPPRRRLVVTLRPDAATPAPPPRFALQIDTVPAGAPAWDAARTELSWDVPARVIDHPGFHTVVDLMIQSVSDSGWTIVRVRYLD